MSSLIFFFYQSFKRKPGQADNERSMGDYNERVNKRLRTVDNKEEKMQDQSQPNTQQESDLYEHIKHGEERYDAQTYGEDLLTYVYSVLYLIL